MGTAASKIVCVYVCVCVCVCVCVRVCMCVCVNGAVADCTTHAHAQGQREGTRLVLHVGGADLDKLPAEGRVLTLANAEFCCDGAVCLKDVCLLHPLVLLLNRCRSHGRTRM